MLVNNALVDLQLARIAEAVAKHPNYPDDPVAKIFGSWKHLHQVGARERAWRAMRTRRTLGKAVAKWGAWLKMNRGLGVDRAAREAIVEAKRFRLLRGQRKRGIAL